LVGWDEENLYVWVTVDDPGLAQFWVEEPFRLWNGDSVSFEFGGDATGLDSSAPLRSDDAHVLLGPVSEEFGAAITAINRPSGGTFVPGTDTAIQAEAFAKSGFGYDVEARIPWWELGVSNPVAGAVFAMNLNVSDVNGDVDGDRRPDLRVMVSNNPDRSAENQGHPGTWTTLVLGP
jgi:hypothetical protein